MIAKNELFESINPNDLLDELLTEYNSKEVINISEEEAELAYSQLYLQGNIITSQTLFNNNKYTMPQAQLAIESASVRKNMFQRLKDWICKKIAGFYKEMDKNENNLGRIILDTLIEYVPGGILIKTLVRKILFFLLNLGYKAMCGIA